MSVLSEILATYQGLANEKRAEKRERPLEFGEIAERAGVSYNTVKGIMGGTTSRPQNENLKNIVAVFIDEGVVPGMDDIRRIWEAAYREGQVDETWFQKRLSAARKRGKIAYDEKLFRRIFEDINPRGVTLAETIKTLGLVDLENRDDGAQRLPPEEIYKLAKHEIVITGPSLYHTFTYRDRKLILEALAAKKWFYVLLLAPNLPAVEFERLKKREGQDIRRDIEQVIGIIVDNGLDQHHTFQVRFLPQVPPFTAVMIDGDVSPDPANEAHPQDAEGQIRVQPGTAYSTQHEGPVFQFKQVPGPSNVNSPFDYYAKDVRKQWKNGVRLDIVLKWLRESGR